MINFSGGKNNGATTTNSFPQLQLSHINKGSVVVPFVSRRAADVALVHTVMHDYSCDINIKKHFGERGILVFVK